ncbi:MAG: glutaredoxin family protein [bacterium]
MFCNYAKEFLSENQVPFVEKNITKDEAAFRELTEDLELMTTPVIQVEDETLVGFNQKRLLELLGLK